MSLRRHLVCILSLVLLPPSTPARAGIADGRWVQLPPPSARWLHGAVYDPVRDRMIVVGGSSARGFANDVWVLPLDGDADWRQVETRGDPPSPRELFSTIYDPVRDRILVFGGLDGTASPVRGDVWALSLGGTPTWTRLVPEGTGPLSRSQHVAVFDPVRDRMLVFGGYHVGRSVAESRPLDDVWALSLSGSPVWTELAPLGVRPSGRSDATAIYDAERDRVIVFGGQIGPLFLNDTWSLSLRGVPRWKELNPRGELPEGRARHTSILDPVTDRMVVFGGTMEGIGAASTWALGLHGREEWVRLEPPSAPPARLGHSAIYDAARGRMVVYGGSPGASRLWGDLWALALDGAPAWTHLAPGVLPPNRRGHAMVYDSSHQRFLLLGGYLQESGSASGQIPFDEIWARPAGSRASSWERLRVQGSPPEAREGHSAIYDPLRDRVVVFGGATDGLTVRNDVWVLDLSGDPTWSRMTPLGSPPVARTTHTAIYDPEGDRMVIHGGVGALNYRDDVWALTFAGTPSWVRLSPSGPIPAARFEHSAIYDPLRRRMVVFGGLTYGSSLGDAWALSLSGAPAWTRFSPAGEGAGNRFGHQAIYDPIRDRMLVFGGTDYSGTVPGSSVAALTLDSPAWSVLAPAGAPPSARSLATATYDPTNDRMLVFGGHGASNDLWALEFGPANGTIVSERAALTSVNEAVMAGPETMHLEVGPNPAWSHVTVAFTLAEPGEAEIRIYDLAGRMVRSLGGGAFTTGTHTLAWDRRTSSGSVARPGIYFCELSSNHRTSTRRIVLAD